MKLLKHENLARLINIHASFQLYGKSLRYRTARVYSKNLYVAYIFPNLSGTVVFKYSVYTVMDHLLRTPRSFTIHFH